MGLDNFWLDDEGKAASIEDIGGVCGGMFSGHGNSSFRGQEYSNIVLNVTGVSLYGDKITAEVIQEMNEEIQNCDYKTAKKHACYELEKEEWINFQKMWDAHAKAGHHLVSWY